MRLVEDYKYKLGREISKYYWDAPSDHEDFNKILNAIDTGGGQTCDVAGVIRELHKSGYRIIKK